MTENPHFDAHAVVSAIANLQDLQRTERRAQLRALLPSIDALVSQGISYEAIARALQRSEIVLKPTSIRQALYRWRKRQASASSIDPRASPLALPPHSTHQSPPSASSKSPPPTAAVTSKADLVQLRKSSQPIDLNALAELGRQK